MKLDVYEVEHEKDKPIAIRFKGEDLSYMIVNGTITIYLDADNSDKLAFQISSLLQDMERKTLTE